MKRLIILLFAFVSLTGYSQNFARSYKSQFASIQFINGKVFLSGICSNDQFLASDEMGEGTYHLNKDTIKLNILSNKYLLLKKTDGIIVSLSDIFNLIKKNEVLYATKYCYSNGNIMMIGREWKKGGKNGKWLFFDENGVVSGLIFDAGKIVGTYIPVIIDEGEE